jgi:hypothetical protein
VQAHGSDGGHMQNKLNYGRAKKLLYMIKTKNNIEQILAEMDRQEKDWSVVAHGNNQR